MVLPSFSSSESSSGFDTGAAVNSNREFGFVHWLVSEGGVEKRRGQDQHCAAPKNMRQTTSSSVESSGACCDVSAVWHRLGYNLLVASQVLAVSGSPWRRMNDRNVRISPCRVWIIWTQFGPRLATGSQIRRHSPSDEAGPGGPRAVRCRRRGWRATKTDKEV